MLKHHEGEQPQEFRKQYIVCSNGLGKAYLKDSRIIRHKVQKKEGNLQAHVCYAPDNRYAYPMPTYYKNHCFDDEDKFDFYWQMHYNPPTEW